MANELNDLFKTMQKQFGEETIFFGNKNNIQRVEQWNIEDLVVSYITGIGIPKGRIIEIYGPESSGKTSLTYYLAAEIQKQGGKIGFVDAEQVIDLVYAKTFGLDPDNCIITQPDWGEQALDMVQTMVESGTIDLVIVDSVAALTPKAELDGAMGDQNMGLQARMMSKACRKLAASCRKTMCSIIFINQIRMKIGIAYGSPEVCAGGVALKFWSSIRLEVRRGEVLKGKNEDALGIMSKIKCVKNKVAMPFRIGEVKILFGKGIQIEEEFIDFALNLNLIQKKGTWYFYDGISLGQGKNAAIEYFKQNPKLYEILKKNVREGVNTIKTDIIIEDKQENAIIEIEETDEEKIDNKIAEEAVKERVVRRRKSSVEESQPIDKIEEINLDVDIESIKDK